MSEWKKEAEKGNIVRAICLYITENDWTIYPDLVTDLAPYIFTRGKQQLVITEHVVLWEGLSYELAYAISEGINEGLLTVLPINKTVYSLSNATIPNLPIVEYRKNMADVPVRSWTSTCLRLAPAKKKKKGK